ELNDIEPDGLRFFDIGVDCASALAEHVFDKPAGRNQHVVTMTDLNQLRQRLARQQAEGPTGELQRIYVRAHGFEKILEISLAHGRVIRAANLGDASLSRLTRAGVHRQEWKCPL